MPAILHQHPSAPVKFDDYPQTASSIAAAIRDCNAERQRITALSGVPIPLHPEPDVRPDALDLYEAVERLMARFGAQRVATVVRNIAAINGAF